MADLRIIQPKQPDPRDLDLAARHAHELVRAFLDATTHTEPLAEALEMACRRVLRPIDQYVPTDELTVAAGHLCDLLRALSALAGMAVITTVAEGVDGEPDPYLPAQAHLDAIAESIDALRHRLDDC